MSVAAHGPSHAIWMVVAVAALCALPAVPAGSALRGAAAGPIGPLAGCAGGLLRSAYSGALVDEGGGAAAPSRANVSIGFGYAYEQSVVNRSTGRVTSRQCLPAQGNATTDADGRFAAALPLPASSCDRYTNVCLDYTGPYGPFAVAVAGGPPPGYGTNVSVDGANVTVALVADLGGVRFSPAGPVAAYSPGAWETLTAVPRMGNGSASPIVPTYNWSLAGSGWAFLLPPGGPEVNVSAAAGATFGEIWVGARWSDGSTSFVVGPANLTLAAVPTAVETGGTNRTSVDAGDRVEVSVTASGAPGYAYSATVRPGLDAPPAALACGTPTPNGTAELLDCRGAVTFPTAGVASPTVVVTNGYSAATAALASVTVAADPTVRVDPSAPFGYAGLPATVTITGRNGTGPFAGACLAPGDGSTACEAGPGPNWTFAPVYPSPGTYTAVASIRDAAGTNATVPVAVDVAPPLSLGAFPTNLSDAAAGAPTYVVAPVGGGFPPLRYWWNASNDPTPLATGSVAGDGPLSVVWIPASPGPTVFSLAIVDARGTVVVRSQLVGVGNDPARQLRALSAPPAAGTMAGAPIDLGWGAFDGAGVPVPSFAASGQLDLVGPNGTVPSPAWVNMSGGDPLPEIGPGAFQVPSAAWSLGALSVSVATTVAGTWSVELVGLAGVPAPPAEYVEVGADLAALRAYDPVVGVAGGRTNATFWYVRDLYGNPAAGAPVALSFAGDGVAYDRLLTVVARPDGRSGVWVNYSAPTGAGGIVELVSPLSGVLVGPLVVPAATAVPGPRGADDGAYAVGALGAAAIGTAVVLLRRRAVRRRRAAEGPASEEELRAFVEGRDRVIQIVAGAGVADLARIDAGFEGASPPAAVSDWVASLVADGTLGARTGPDGVARFCLTGPAEGPARIVVDPAAAERARAAREALRDDDAEPDDQAGSRPTRS